MSLLSLRECNNYDSQYVQWEVLTIQLLNLTISLKYQLKLQHRQRSGDLEDLRIWTPEISTELTQKKATFGTNGNFVVIPKILVDMKEASKRFRRACRVEYAKQRFDMRQKILGARSENVTLFHKLINKQRGRLSNCIDEFHVGDSVYKTDSGILNGWFEHFRALVANEDSACTQNYHKLVQQEFPQIKDICKWDLEFF